MCEPHYSGDSVSPLTHVLPHRKKPVWGLGGKINLHQTQTWHESRRLFLLPCWILEVSSLMQTPLFPKGSSPLAISRGSVHLCVGPAAPSALDCAAHFSVLQQRWFNASIADRMPPAGLHPVMLPLLLLLFRRNNLHLLRTHRGVARVFFTYM